MLADIERNLQLSQFMRLHETRSKFFNLRLMNSQIMRRLISESALEENLLLLEKGILANNICHLEACEKFISVQIHNEVIEVHQEFLSLVPGKKIRL